MKNYKTILFDLDGTLTDPGIGITNSVAYALERYGIHVEDKTTLNPFIGPPLADSFQKYYGFDEKKSYEAVDVYREYFSVTGIFENKVYDGTEFMLQSLIASGKELVLATSKPTVFANEILKHFGLDMYFNHVIGSEMDGRRTNKADVIAYALSVSGASSENAIMIGDREYDIIGAKKCGLDSIGVTFGYGSPEELSSAGADFIADTPEDISKILVGNHS